MANRKINADGRSKKEGWHIRFYHWELDTPAFRSLSPVAKALLIELKRRYNSLNNGLIHLSHRDAAKAINAAVNTIKRGLRELVEKGFIRVAQLGSFSQKIRHATTWILTEYPCNGQLPTKEFSRLTENDVAANKNKTRWQELTPTVLVLDTDGRKTTTADTA